MWFWHCVGWPFNRGMDGDYNGKLPAPIVPETETASSTAFYEKGAAVNRMFSSHLGQDNWFDALSYHLRRHSYGNPRLPDLLESFAATLPAPKFSEFGKKVQQWLLQPGMPLITLSVDNERHTLDVWQRPSAPSINQSQLWWVPLHVRFTPRSGNCCGTASAAGAGAIAAVDGAPAADVLYVDMLERHESVALPAGVAPTDYMQGNYNFSAFVLVNYTDPAQWEHLTAEMARPDFPAIDRQQLQKQLFYLASLEDLAGPSMKHLTRTIRLYTGQLLSSCVALPANPAATLALVASVMEVWQQVVAAARTAKPTITAETAVAVCTFTRAVDEFLAAARDLVLERPLQRRDQQEVAGCRAVLGERVASDIEGYSLYWMVHTSECDNHGDDDGGAAWARYVQWAAADSGRTNFDSKDALLQL